MKKLLALLLVSSTALAGAQQELSERLSMSAGFSADFTQVVTSPEGDVVMEGEGTVEIARPSLFRWTTTLPDENVLVSDGQSIWYYSPFIEQVSIFWQEQAAAQTPFILLTRDQESDWDNYQVSQAQDVFTLVPTSQEVNQGTFQIIINDAGEVSGFKVIEQDGQKGDYRFTNLSSQAPKRDRFTFVVPDGVEVDDQRN
ncbi:outer membrane lipoprotein chaperone LolA [Vibrio astriarenae]|jgi:outer membrane lipoprotein carrier protein|uniref:outer membrane lipoprotein chaperone LolA n=1 Tax=Vibrio agarivorans TaxID=153622 RepID=UPI00222F5888|nr:outer membrane lipoprotein chaperone LolA [Vibrio agarivorans]MDN3660612.1 outer membrane lipoprotein chaperone LolA [Vibrio agarivorans]